MTQPQESDKTDDFLWHVHSYTNEYIRFADTKAAMVVGWTGALQGVMLTTKAHHLFNPNRWAGWFEGEFFLTVLTCLCILAFLALAIGFVMAVWAIQPRLWRLKMENATPGLIFWDSVLEIDGFDQYLKLVRESSPSGQDDAAARHIFELARICKRKYFYIRVAIFAGFVGTLCSAFVLLAIV